MTLLIGLITTGLLDKNSFGLNGARYAVMHAANQLNGTLNPLHYIREVNLADEAAAESTSLHPLLAFRRHPCSD